MNYESWPDKALQERAQIKYDYVFPEFTSRADMIRFLETKDKLELESRKPDPNEALRLLSGGGVGVGGVGGIGGGGGVGVGAADIMAMMGITPTIPQQPPITAAPVTLPTVTLPPATTLPATTTSTTTLLPTTTPTTTLPPTTTPTTLPSPKIELPTVPTLTSATPAGPAGIASGTQEPVKPPVKRGRGRPRKDPTNPTGRKDPTGRKPPTNPQALPLVTDLATLNQARKELADVKKVNPDAIFQTRPMGLGPIMAQPILPPAVVALPPTTLPPTTLPTAETLPTKPVAQPQTNLPTLTVPAMVPAAAYPTTTTLTTEPSPVLPPAPVTTTVTTTVTSPTRAADLRVASPLKTPLKTPEQKLIASPTPPQFPIKLPTFQPATIPIQMEAAAPGISEQAFRAFGEDLKRELGPGVPAVLTTAQQKEIDDLKKLRDLAMKAAEERKQAAQPVQLVQPVVPVAPTTLPTVPFAPAAPVAPQIQLPAAIQTIQTQLPPPAQLALAEQAPTKEITTAPLPTFAPLGKMEIPLTRPPGGVRLTSPILTPEQVGVVTLPVQTSPTTVSPTQVPQPEVKEAAPLAQAFTAKQRAVQEKINIDVSKIKAERSKKGDGSYSVDELKLIAAQLNLKKTGNKKDLVARILEYLQKQ